MGPYEILEAIGAGGMGEVYRARDTRLNRTLAIKILPQHLTEKADAKQRFEREAHAISAMNHAHICTLYDVGHQDGTDFLVMEFLEGETLAKRLEKGPLPTAELLRIAMQIADALDKTHRQGILHRDLKPSNIMLTKSGAKLMDFGLAKAVGNAAVSPSPGLTRSLSQHGQGTPVTAEGTILGTFQYMAPEVVEGKEADARSDIFSLGAVLFEMATGKRAFEGKTTASVIAAILEREPPPISQLQPMSPPELDRLVKTCLAKDADERIQSAHDAKLQLEWIRDAGSQAGQALPIAAAHHRHRERIAWGTVAVLVVALAVVGYIARAPQPASAVISQILPPEGAKFVLNSLDAGPVVISPDGQKLVVTAIGSDGKQLLWVKLLNSVTAQPLAGTDGAEFPLWSPDSRSLGFFANRKLNRIDSSGGPPVAIADDQSFFGGAWGSDGSMLFIPDVLSGIYRLPSMGAAPMPVTKLNASRSESHHSWPQFLPDGKHFLFYAHSTTPENSGTYAASVDGGEPKLIVHCDSNAIYAAPGYLFLIREHTLMAQRFDAAALALTGDAIPLAEQVLINSQSSLSMFSVSQNGVLTYHAGTEATGSSKLLWFDRTGKQIAQTGAMDNYYEARISPDGKKVVATVASGPVNNIWVFDVARGIKTRLTFDSNFNVQPAWSFDGKAVAFLSVRAEKAHLYEAPADGTGKEAPLVVDDAGENYPSFSLDGRYLIFGRFTMTAGSRQEIWAVPLFGVRKPFPILQNQQSNVSLPALSPDAKWLAYVSAESGQPQVYVVPFPHGAGKWQISTSGGSSPLWRGDGRELFYMSSDNKIMSAEITESGSGPVIGSVHALFQANPNTELPMSYDVTADGRRFLITTAATPQTAEPMTLVVNWPALLKKQ